MQNRVVVLACAVQSTQRFARATDHFKLDAPGECEDAARHKALQPNSLTLDVGCAPGFGHSIALVGCPFLAETGG